MSTCSVIVLCIISSVAEKYDNIITVYTYYGEKKDGILMSLSYEE